jgi:DeoR family transcriptional regulator of aga operon
MDTFPSLSNVERQEQILGFITEQRRVTVAQVCDKFIISEATARRDLEMLSKQGKIQRVHGGAIIARTLLPEQPVLQRMVEQADEKKRIGRAVAQLIRDDETVFLGTGTTVVEVARNLAERKNLTVITNSLLVINTLVDFSNITLIGLGGVFRRSELSFIGHITQQSLSEVRADKVVISVGAVDAEQGLTNHYLPETMTDRAILQIGRQVIIAVDHNKCGRVSAAFLAPLSAAHILVTDSITPAEFVNSVRVQGIQVIQV